ncbi:BRO1-like domain-containing protein [Dipodascopsis tothii]|uniref:BRO1-like domain-containing protein n=1 Tax=Dipodascopsis tothii TaxID=44089 RepID=UPI0034CD466A
MAPTPKIAIPVKTTKTVDWAAPLRIYIRENYGSEDFNAQAQAFSRLREDMSGAGTDATGRDIIYRYYGQLEMLDLRIPVDDSGCRVSFTWMDAYSKAETTQRSIAFEKASVLFNLASTHSHIAADAGDLKVAYRSFQAAAGVYTYVAENFLHAPSADLNRDTVKALAALMLAQAQEVFVERLLAENSSKPAMLAKLARAAADLHAAAVEGLNGALEKGWGNRDWVKLGSVKQYLYTAVAAQQQALAHAGKNKHGTGIAYTRAAINSLQAARRSFLPAPYQATLGETMAALAAVLDAQLDTLEKDNDFVYHTVVPAAAGLPEVAALEAAKPTPMAELYKDQDITKITGRDTFEKLIPVSVAEQSSLYAEETAKIVRAEGERVDVADEEAASTLDFLGLPAALKSVRMAAALAGTDGGLDDRVVAWATKVRAAPPYDVAELDKLKADIYQTVQHAKTLLAAEERECEDARARFGPHWTQSPSAALTSTLTTDIRNIMDSLWSATATDKKLAAQYAAVRDDVALLARGPDAPELRRLFGLDAPALVDIAAAEPAQPPDTDAIDGLLKKLALLKKERGLVFAELKAKIQDDDISSLLLLNKKVQNVQDELFKPELAKYVPYQKRISETVARQTDVLRDLTTAWRAILANPAVRDKRRQLDDGDRLAKDGVARLKKAFDVWTDVTTGKQKGRKFYTDVFAFAQSTLRNAQDFVDNRRDEARRLAAALQQRGF